MTKGLFTSTEEIVFQNFYVNGWGDPVKVSFQNRCEIRQENKRIAQNVKRLNQKVTPFYIRTR